MRPLLEPPRYPPPGIAEAVGVGASLVGWPLLIFVGQLAAYAVAVERLGPLEAAPRALRIAVDAGAGRTFIASLCYTLVVVVIPRFARVVLVHGTSGLGALAFGGLSLALVFVCPAIGAAFVVLFVRDARLRTDPRAVEAG